MTKEQIESKVLTVSEIAEEAGVSRNLVWSYIRNHKIKPIVKEKRKYKFDSDIVLKIKQKQAKKQANNGENKNNDSVSKDVLEILHEQLRVKDEQINEQAETINFLRSEVVQARLESKKNRICLKMRMKRLKLFLLMKLKRKSRRNCIGGKSCFNFEFRNSNKIY